MLPSETCMVTDAENGSDAFVRRACLLAACGWDACQLSSLVLGGRSPQHTAGLPAGACEMQQSVLGCSMCGARAGLWSFADQPGQACLAFPALRFVVMDAALCHAHLLSHHQLIRTSMRL